jgi:hypothetical protein
LYILILKKNLKNPLIKLLDKKRIYMNEVNQNLAENIGNFLLGFRDEVVKGIEEYLIINGNLSVETL